MKKAKVLVMKAKMKNQLKNKRCFESSFPCDVGLSVLLTCCIVWSLPKTFFSRLPAENYFVINWRIVPVSNIAELVEYDVLLPHNNEVTKPRALNTFLDGLAELGIDKGLIKNKKLLSDLINRKGKRPFEMKKILPRTRVIMRRVHRILKIWRRR